MEDDDSAEEGYIRMYGYRLPLTEIVGSDLLLTDLEETTLCRSDCEGLCTQCGANLNDKPCDCETEQFLDPRFDVLRSLLGKEESNL